MPVTIIPEGRVAFDKARISITTCCLTRLLDNALITVEHSEARKSYVANKKVLSILAAPLRKAKSKQQIQSTRTKNMLCDGKLNSTVNKERLIYKSAHKRRHLSISFLITTAEAKN